MIDVNIMFEALFSAVCFGALLAFLAGRYIDGKPPFQE